MITILGNAAANRYQVIGYQRQEKGAEEFTKTNRMVEVYWRTSNFDKRKGRLNGPVNNDMTLSIELTASAASSVDLAVIDNPASTPVQIEAAMVGFKEASDIADDSIDDLFEVIYQIIMDARNIDLGLPEGQVANRWVSTMTKNDPNPRGSLVVLTGLVDFNCDAEEQVPGDAGEPGVNPIDMAMEINEDTVQKTGVLL